MTTHIPCPKCGSSDAAQQNKNNIYCHSCKQTSPLPAEAVGNATTTSTKSKVSPVPTTGFVALNDRQISQKTAARFGVSVPTNGGHVYPYYDSAGLHVGNKVRSPGPKAFYWEGFPNQATLFGQHLFPAGSAKAITLVEGECDAMAAYEMQDSKYPCVSVHSAGQAKKNVADNFEYLNSFPQIVVCFDKDEPKVAPDGSVRYPGQEAALAVASMFPIGKVRILTLERAKDPNDYLIKGWQESFRKEWWAAPKYTPTGLKIGRDMWDEVSKPKNYETISYPFEGLNRDTYGLRLSELVIITAKQKVGKTSVLKEIEHHILETTKSGLGLLHLEESNADTAVGLMSITASLPLHLPDVREKVTPDEFRGYFDTTVNNDRIVIWDHFGSNSIHEVLAKIRHMHNLGCKYIILDHLSIVVSDQSGDERKQLDEITTKLKTMCMELNICVIAVIHQNRQGQIRGTAGVEQLANIVFRLERNKEDPDEWRRNVTKIVTQENRFCGVTGPSSYVWYDPKTGRLNELNAEEIKTFETGSSLPEDERW